MEWINYHHLLYFWTIAREGGVVKATRVLKLAQPTLSAQIRSLEGNIGEPLFHRKGRGLELTDMGRMVYRYAEEIFSLGRELMDVVKGRPTGRSIPLRVGVADVLPKLIAYRLLRPALHLPESVRMVCYEDKPEKLLAELSVNELDLVLSDAPLPVSVKIRAYSHLLGECSMSFFAAPSLAKRLKRCFPDSLNGAPFLAPTENTLVRQTLEHWFQNRNLHPIRVAEFEDSALMKSFGQAGEGVFTAPSVIEKEIQAQYRVKLIGREPSLRERFYAISVEKKIKHPAVLPLCESARHQLFGERV
ncbi:MAG: transcriptional activator NhaR [bacterium]